MSRTASTAATDTVDDLIDLFDADLLTRSPSFRHISYSQDVLQPDRASASPSGSSTRTATGPSVSASAVGELISFAQRAPAPQTPVVAQPTPSSSLPTAPTLHRARAIPLPKSPADQTDLQSISGQPTASSATSTLSPDAPAFNATGRIHITPQSPLSFYPQTPSASTSGSATEFDQAPSESTYAQWASAGESVSAGDMDSGFFRSGYGGGSPDSSWLPTQSPAIRPPYLAPAQARSAIRITSPPPSGIHQGATAEAHTTPSAAVGNQDTPSPATATDTSGPETPKTPTPPATPSSIVATSPLSMRLMRDSASPPSSPESSPSVHHAELRLDADHEPIGITRDDRDPIRQITESFRSISLRPGEARAFVPRDISEGEHPSVSRSHTPMSSCQRQGPDGLLTPNVTGDPEAEKGDHDGEASFGQDTTLVTEPSPNTLIQATDDELDDIERAWQAFRDGYSLFCGSLEESLFRLRNGEFNLSRPAAGISASQEARLSHARQLAYQSQIKSLRQQLEGSRNENQNLREELDTAKRRVSSATIGQQSQAVQLEKLRSDLEISERRRTEVAGRLLRLQEEHEVLRRVTGQPDEPFIIVLLEADGRMFDQSLLRQGVEGGYALVTSMISRLATMYEHLRPGAAIPRVVVHLFVDVKATIKELQEVGWISRSSKFQNHLEGMRQGHSLVTIHDIRGTDIPERVKAQMNHYSGLGGCSMVILGTPWPQQIGYTNNPYTAIVADWQRDARIEKLHCIRTTARFETDPFAPLGEAKLLYLPHVYPTDVEAWKTLMGWHSSQTSTTADGASTAVSSTSTMQNPAPRVAESSQALPCRIDVSTSTAPIRRPPSVMSSVSTSTSLATPSPPPTASQPSWAVHLAARAPAAAAPATTGGSLLDQHYADTASRSGAASPGSDRTVGPGGAARNETIVAIDGSPGGSPASSDSAEPSVPLPHSAKKHVRLPTTFNNADDDLVSEASSTFTASSAGALAVRKAMVSAVASVQPRMPRNRAPPNNARAPRAPSPSASLILSAPNSTPLGRGSTAGPSTTAQPQPRRSLIDRMCLGGPPSQAASSSNLIDLASQRTRNGGTVHGFRIQGAAGGRGNANGNRSASHYHYLRSLDPLACHNLYLKGRCSLRTAGCPYGHDYILDQGDISMLKILAKKVNCSRINKTCHESAQDCIYSHGCPHRANCPYGAKCWFIDNRGFHIE